MKENMDILKRETKKMRIGDILDHPLNPKNHPDRQIKAIDASVGEIGKFDNPKAYYSERNGGKLTLFHGHGRKQRNPDDTWEVDIYPDYTDEQADKAIMYGDPLVGLAVRDDELFEQLKNEIITDNEILLDVINEKDFDYSIYESDFDNIPNVNIEGEVDNKREHLIISFENIEDYHWCLDQFGLKNNQRVVSFNLIREKWGII